MFGKFGKIPNKPSPSPLPPRGTRDYGATKEHADIENEKNELELRLLRARVAIAEFKVEKNERSLGGGAITR